MVAKIFYRLTLVIALSLASISAGANTIIVNPGNIGETFTNFEIPFFDLNGETFTSGQTLSEDFVLTTGKDAVYRYDGIGSQSLYGWTVALNFGGQPTVISQPNLSNVLPYDASGSAVGHSVGTIMLYNNNFVAYVANYNSQYSLGNLLAFTNTAYHSIHMDLTLPVFAEGAATISSASFVFNTNGTGEYTQLVASVPELNTNLMLLMGLGLFGFMTRRRVIG